MNTRKHYYHLSVLVTSALLLGAASVSKAATKAPDSQPLSQVQIATVPFIVNQGRAAEGVEFYAYTFAGQVAISKSGEFHCSFHGREAEQSIQVAVNETPVGAKVSAVRGEQRSRPMASQDPDLRARESRRGLRRCAAESAGWRQQRGEALLR